jgi:hypothetical protein
MRKLNLAALLFAVVLSAAVAGAPVLMSGEWAKDACEPWNKDPVLTDKLR